MKSLQTVGVVLAAILVAGGCGRLHLQDNVTARRHQVRQQAATADLATRALRRVGYPPAPELQREVLRLIRERRLQCPRLSPAAIARALPRRYDMPWHRIKAEAHRVGMSSEDYALITIRFVHVGILEEEACEGRQE